MKKSLLIGDMRLNFDTMLFSYSNVMMFCNNFLRLDYPTLTDYSEHRGAKRLTMTERRPGLVIEVIFSQQPKNKNHTVLVKLFNTTNGIYLEECIDAKTYSRYLTYARHGVVVYMYYMTKSFIVFKETTNFFISGVEGVVQCCDEEMGQTKPKGGINVAWLRTKDILRRSLAYVWFYDQDKGNEARNLLSTICHAQRKRYLKNQYKRGKIIRVKNQKPKQTSKWLAQLFMYCGASKNIAGRICHVLNCVGIYNLEDFRKNKISVERFRQARNIGPKSLAIYEHAYELVEKLHG